MAYSKQTWSDNNPTYPLSAARMGVIEQGIFDAATVADQGHRILTTVQRDALTGVTAGTMIYNSTAQRVEVYNGTAWSGTGGGLVPIVSADLAGASSYAFDNVFSASYDNYRVVISNYIGPANLYGLARMSGTDDTTNVRDLANWADGPYYTYSALEGMFYGGSSSSYHRSTEWIVLWNTFANPVGEPAHASYDVFGPYLPKSTAWMGLQHEVTYYLQSIGTTTLWNPEFNVHDGFRLYVSSGTITSGSVTVYGYREA